MARQTLFAALSRSPWWLSLVIAGLLFAALRAAFPALVAASAALPFVALALYAAWRQWRVPDEADLAAVLERLRELPWERFAALITDAFRREGYEVRASSGGAADFELRRDGRSTLASCRRWKSAQSGVAPLRELAAAREKREADECLYVCAGTLSEQAQSFAARNRVRLLHGAELARLLRRHL
jgi:restriction system protein